MARGQNGVRGSVIVPGNNFIEIEHARTHLPSTMAPTVSDLHMITDVMILHAAPAVQVLKHMVKLVCNKRDIAIMCKKL